MLLKVRFVVVCSVQHISLYPTADPMYKVHLRPGLIYHSGCLQHYIQLELEFFQVIAISNRITDISSQ